MNPFLRSENLKDPVVEADKAPPEPNPNPTLSGVGNIGGLLAESVWAVGLNTLPKIIKIFKFSSNQKR